MEFIGVCMSPALDATVTLQAWPSDGSIAKDVDEVENVGGKGVNVARWLALRAAGGVRVGCGGMLGEDNALPFERELAKYGIADRFARVPGSTRRNEMIVTPGGSFKLNRKAFPGVAEPPSSARIAELCGAGATASGPLVVVISGSLPKCCGDDYYVKLCGEFRARGAIVVLDASGEPLRQAVLGGDASTRPQVIKPNAEECLALTGYVPKTPDEFRRATAELNRLVPTVLISDGAAGCWFNGEFAPAPSVDVLDTTAAGDTLLAEWCWRRYGEENPEAASWAVAAGSAACTMPGGDPPSAELVQRLRGTARA